MDFEQAASIGPPAGEAGAWLEFVQRCYETAERHRLGERRDDATPALHAAAARLQGATSRVLALTMLTRLAGQLAGADAMVGVVTEEIERTAREPKIMNSRALAVLAYVEEHHSSSSCHLEDIAGRLRVSRSYLSRLVLRETGATFNKHLQLARMNTAARLLQSSHLSVKEISTATGYEHVPSFDRQFRRHFRMTPGQFRRGIRI
jgi:AraC-like DNA-binding protein